MRKNEFLNIRSGQLGLKENTSGIIWSLTPAQNGTIWAGNSQPFAKGLLNLDLRSGKVIRYVRSENDMRSVGGNSIKQVMEDRRRNIWVVTLGKLQLFDSVRKEFKKVPLCFRLHDRLTGTSAAKRTGSSVVSIGRSGTY